MPDEPVRSQGRSDMADIGRKQVSGAEDLELANARVALGEVDLAPELDPFVLAGLDVDDRAGPARDVVHRVVHGHLVAKDAAAHIITRAFVWATRLRFGAVDWTKMIQSGLPFGRSRIVSDGRPI